MDNQRIKIKIGTAEFEAEGPQDLVNQQFEAFMKAVATAPQALAVPSSAAPAAASPPSSPATPLPTNGAVSQEVMSRVFRTADGLSLAALPHSDNAAGDALLALLYGYEKVRGESQVTGTSLMKSLKVSGINVERVDRAIAPYEPEFVLSGGVKKARRYQLNNRGRARAEEIINAIYQ